ncbi:hypothetical protein ACP0HM_11065 [Escherichia coli]
MNYGEITRQLIASLAEEI